MKSDPQVAICFVRFGLRKVCNEFVAGVLALGIPVRIKAQWTHFLARMSALVPVLEKKPPTSNIYSQMVVPPPSVRDVIDKTAAFVAEHGIEYERRMMVEADAVERLGFLFAGHGYRAYYDAKLQQYRTGNIIPATFEVPQAVQQIRAPSNNLMLTADGESGDNGYDLEFIKLADENYKNTLLGPESNVFSANYSKVLTHLQLDIILLVAKFTACNGPKFAQSIAFKEKGNPLFEFVKTGTTHNGLFHKLVKAYSMIVENAGGGGDSATLFFDYSGQPPGATLNEDEKETCKLVTAAKIWRREGKISEYMLQKKVKQEKEELMELRMRNVRWERFVLVECIKFSTEDQRLPLAPPRWEKMTTKITLDPPLPEEKEESGTEGAKQEELPKSEAEASAPASASSAPASASASASVTERNDEPTSEEPPSELPQIQGGEKLTIKTNYVRKSKRPHSQAQTATMVKCPITGEIIPAEQYSNHLRVLLMDKQWKVQRDELLARAVADSAYAPDKDIETNISDFVLRRPDLFGSVEEEIREAVTHTQKRSRTES